MVNKRDRGDLTADQDHGLRCSTELNRAAASSSADTGLQGYIDVHSYAMVVYRANIELGLVDGQNEYNAPSELEDRLAQTSAASTVRGHQCKQPGRLPLEGGQMCSAVRAPKELCARMASVADKQSL